MEGQEHCLWTQTGDNLTLRGVLVFKKDALVGLQGLKVGLSLESAPEYDGMQERETKNTTVMLFRMLWTLDTQRVPRTRAVCSPGCPGAGIPGLFFFDVVGVGGLLVLVGYGQIGFFVRINFDGRLILNPLGIHAKSF
jgi:hypothetical protein